MSTAVSHYEAVRRLWFADIQRMESAAFEHDAVLELDDLEYEGEDVRWTWRVSVMEDRAKLAAAFRAMALALEHERIVV